MWDLKIPKTLSFWPYSRLIGYWAMQIDDRLLGLGFQSQQATNPMNMSFRPLHHSSRPISYYQLVQAKKDPRIPRLGRVGHIPGQLAIGPYQ